METVFLFFIAFRFVGCIGGLIFAWKIASLPVTPTKTWTLFVLGWVALLANTAVGFLYVRPVQEIVSDEPLAWFSLVAGSLFVLFFFSATVRVYFELKGKFKQLL